MQRTIKSLSRATILLAVAASVSSCTSWIEQEFARSNHAIDCAIISTAPAAPTSLQANCATHPAAA